MLVLTILFVFIFIIVLLVFIEYRNEKKYQEERRRPHKQPDRNKRSTTSATPSKTAPKPEPQTRTEPKPEPKIEVVKETKELPKANYPQFTHMRLVEMGLSDEEAKEFVGELIPQIETQFPLIEKAMLDLDFHQMERLTHGIKGSATNLGTGGVSDLLVEYNTYLKTGTDIDIAQAYFRHLVHYNNELKAQYA